MERWYGSEWTGQARHAKRLTDSSLLYGTTEEMQFPQTPTAETNEETKGHRRRRGWPQAKWDRFGDGEEPEEHVGCGGGGNAQPNQPPASESPIRLHALTRLSSPLTWSTAF